MFAIDFVVQIAWMIFQIAVAVAAGWCISLFIGLFGYKSDYMNAPRDYIVYVFIGYVFVAYPLTAAISVWGRK